MSQRNQNPYDVPVDKITWLKAVRNSWENPLKVVLGPSDTLMAGDGRPFVRIAELYAPTKCTYHCHPNNFSPMGDLAKRIALGMETP